MKSCKEFYEMVKESVHTEKRVAIIQIGNDHASARYARNKAKDLESIGAYVSIFNYAEGIPLGDLHSSIMLNCMNHDAIMIMEPFPQMYEPIIRPILKAFDNKNLDRISCTAHGIMSWLKWNDYDLTGKNVTIIGRSQLVGRPLAQLMTDADATVTLCHSHTPANKLVCHCLASDVVVSAAGQAGLIHQYMVQPSCLVIDVGINMKDGKLVGDCEPNIVGLHSMDPKLRGARLGYQTPVPGGVGLLTRAQVMLELSNM